MRISPIQSSNYGRTAKCSATNQPSFGVRLNLSNDLVKFVSAQSACNAVERNLPYPMAYVITNTENFLHNMRVLAYEVLKIQPINLPVILEISDAAQKHLLEISDPQDCVFHGIQAKVFTQSIKGKVYEQPINNVMPPNDMSELVVQRLNLIAGISKVADMFNTGCQL